MKNLTLSLVALSLCSNIANAGTNKCYPVDYNTINNDGVILEAVRNTRELTLTNGSLSLPVSHAGSKYNVTLTFNEYHSKVEATTTMILSPSTFKFETVNGGSLVN